MRKLTAALLAATLCPATGLADFPDIFDGLFVVLDEELSGEEMHVEDVSPAFFFIPGTIIGNVKATPMYRVPKGDSAQLSFSLSDAADIANKQATTQTPVSLEYGLRVTPKETRLLRIGTIAFDHKHRIALGAGISEPGKSGNLILIYVDRPCRIEGDVNIAGKTYLHEIELDRSGFHWVRLELDGSLQQATNVGAVIFSAFH